MINKTLKGVCVYFTKQNLWDEKIVPNILFNKPLLDPQ